MTAERLLTWYDEHKRDLPWRRTRDPYRKWVAEVMLVQTQVDKVIPYYRRFIARFPDVQTLAAAGLDEVLKAWEGLGYYARARYLHSAAEVVVAKHGGQLPRDRSELEALPGIGPYVAAAIQSMAFDQQVVAVDGNVRRVICRLHDLPNPSVVQIRELAKPWVEGAGEGAGAGAGARPGDLNQALMDLGATVCLPRKPRCAVCPLESHCLARARGTESERPTPRRARRRPHHDIAVGLVWRGSELLIAKRRPHGLLGGLWEFPGGKREPGESLEAAVVREIGEELGIEVEAGEKIAAIDHAYSHFAITMHAFHCRYRRGTPKPLGCEEYAWVSSNELDRYAFPAANRRLLEQLTARPHRGAGIV